MAAKVILPKDTLGKFSRSFLVLGFLLFFPSRIARALPFNVELFPKGHSLEVEQAPPPSNSLSDCFASQGRVFNFSPGTSFRLGGVGFFFFEDYNSQNGVLDTTKLRLSIFSGDSVDSLSALIFRNPFQNNDASYNKSLSLFGNGLAKGVFFELIHPIWLSQNQNYSILIECNNPSGSVQKIYGGGNTTGARSFDSNLLAAAPNANLRVPYFQLYSKNDGLVAVAPTPPTPSSRPVVFIHGLGGAPSDFSDYTSLLLSQNWNSANVLTFDYGLKNDGSYNGLPNLDDLLPRLRASLVTLSASYKAEGGDGKVDIMAYSSGALLARNYLGSYKENSLVKKFVAVGGLFRGSFLADLETGNDNFPGAGVKLPLSLAKTLLGPLKALHLLTAGRFSSDESFKIDLASSGGSVLKFQKASLPSDVAYFSLRGEIKARNIKKLFNTSVKSEGFLGDGASLSVSADDLPNATATLFEESFDLAHNFVRQAATVSATINLPELSKLKYLHSNLLKSAEIKKKVLEILGN